MLLSFVGAAASADRVVVTGGRVVYDAFGRVIKTYHPTVDRLDVSVYSDTVDAEPPTVTEYDVLDRPVKVTYPDSTFTETAYGVSGPVQVVTVTDALGNESKTHVDGSGRTVKSTSKEPSLFSFQSVKDSNKRLYNALAKLERNSKAGKNEVRIQRDSNKVDIARNRANSNAVAYGTEKTKQKAISNGVTETIREANKRQKRNDR